MDHQWVGDEAALGDPQVGIEEGPRNGANPQPEDGLGHQAGREHPPVAKRTEPRPFCGELDQGRQQQDEAEQDDQGAEPEATPPAQRQTESLRWSGHGDKVAAFP